MNNNKKTRVRELFEIISSIPRPSYHEEKIADFIYDFAIKSGCEAYRDEANNVLVNLKATVGYENRAAVLLQGHTDMVCEKNEGVEHDFLNEGIKLVEKDGFIRADGTTLGADNGVAVAIMLYVIEGGIGEHPAIQCLFTSSEEVGLDGAKAFDYSKIFARRMLNMDGENEGLVIVGCAGGVRSNITFKPSFVPCCGEIFKVLIKGLCGGHSGENISSGRANANILIGRLLGEIAVRTRLNLVDIHGGTKDNAIPREASAVIAVENAAVAKETAEKFAVEIVGELSAADRGFLLSCDAVPSCERMMDDKSTKDILTFIMTVKNGVLEMSKTLSGLVEYSRNLGIIECKEDSVVLVCSSRSAIDRQLDHSQRELDMLADACSAETLHYNRYPGWEYCEKSEMAEKYAEAAKKLFGVDIKREIIHAGLECGIIKSNIPDMDCISCGPNMQNLHSPDEAVEIASFDRYTLAVEELLRTV